MLAHNAFGTERHTMSADDLTKFYTRDGWLSDYSLDCGYLEHVYHNNQWLLLWKDGCYHVRWFDFAENKRVLWETFDSLTEARAFYKKQAQLLEAQ